jgi:protein SCO1/2
MLAWEASEMVCSGRILNSMKRLSLAAAVCAFAALHAWGAQEHVVQGMLLKLDREHRSVLISCNAVPGFMDAMVMQFVVRQPNQLRALEPGTTVRFTMVEQNHEVYAENLKPISGETVEAEPTEAARLDFLHRAVSPNATSREVPVGEEVSDFTLFDQTQTPTRLTQFRGKVVVLSFTYSRCPNPGYCFRLSNNLAFLRKRFRDSLGRDLILMTIVIDPDNDRGKTLQDYVDIWKADPKAWRFLTGSLPEVRNVAELFGMSFWSDEGFLTHSFHTVVIDRSGRLAANVQGNQFAATQLGDLVQTVLRQDPASVSATGSNSRSN